ncbi:11267_t:CDS:2, partial [Funneliformis caledonium]
SIFTPALTKQTEEILKKYWNSFKIVMINSTKKSARNKILFTTGISITASLPMEALILSSEKCEHGTGKTTLIQNTILKLEESKSVVHFECLLDSTNCKEIGNPSE